jgi:ubiquinone/menaquinone biosynthesis C-methylase UbiE
VSTEPQKVAERYTRRLSLADNERYSMIRPEVLLSAQERQRAIVAYLARTPTPLNSLKLLEIGCGNGRNLLELLQIGLNPENLVANELLPERAEAARKNLPSGCRLIHGDATALDFEDHSFDVVYQSTVFTSLLDSRFQERLAAMMWRWVRPGGAVLWYDFVYNNPRNPDVRGVSLGRLKKLFPAAEFAVKRVTLAPPISRRVCRVYPGAYHLFNAIPWLRTHVICWLEKRAAHP